MSYESKIASASQVIEKHNSNVETSQKINFEDFLGKLKSLGGTSEETLQAVSWEDLQECGVPKILARALSSIFRKESDVESSKTVWISDKKASTMTNKELLERYNPKESSNAIANRLRSISKGEPCIIFKDDGTIDVESSEKIINDIQEGLPPRKVMIVNDLPVNVYKVGDCQERFFDENPIFKGMALRGSDGVCSETGVVWNGVPEEIRQLIYLAVNHTEEIKISKLSDVDDLMDLIKKANYAKLAKRYPKAALKLDSLKKTGNPPILKVGSLSSKSQDRKTNNPFGQNASF